MPRWPRGCVSTTSQSTTLLLLPPAAASIRLSLCGWNLICQVSDGGVSITAFVLLSCSKMNMLSWNHQEEDTWLGVLCTGSSPQEGVNPRSP